MDVKSIIREMLKKGMTEDQIRESLVDLGIENADDLIKQATEQFKEVSLAASAPKNPPVVQPPVPAKPTSSIDSEKPPEGLFGSFDAQKAVESAKPREPVKPAASLMDVKDDQIKPLAITSITEEGETEVTVGGNLDAPSTGDSLVTPMPTTSLGDMDSVEKKLDETIALLKALQDINKKILETERSVLLRLKT